MNKFEKKKNNLGGIALPHFKTYCIAGVTMGVVLAKG